jgi:hypothetical protein
VLPDSGIILSVPLNECAEYNFVLRENSSAWFISLLSLLNFAIQHGMAWFQVPPIQSRLGTCRKVCDKGNKKITEQNPFMSHVMNELDMAKPH